MNPLSQPQTQQIPFALNVEPVAGDQLRFTFGVAPVLLVQLTLPLTFGETLKGLIDKARREMPRIVPAGIIQ